jgi:magnesium-transporting ATPase (P-type)
MLEAMTDRHPAHGLTEAEAAKRRSQLGPAPEEPRGRSYKSIVRANVLTVFNLILAVAGGLTLAFGEWQDALFLGILVANSGIGILQEVRAKQALDRLGSLIAPHATVSRGRSPSRSSCRATWCRSVRVTRSSPTARSSRATAWSSTSRS